MENDDKVNGNDDGGKEQQSTKTQSEGRQLAGSLLDTRTRGSTGASENYHNDSGDDNDCEGSVTAESTARAVAPPVSPRRQMNVRRFGLRLFLCPPSVRVTVATSEQTSDGGDEAEGVEAVPGVTLPTHSKKNDDAATATIHSTEVASSAAKFNVLSELFRRSTFPTRYGPGGRGGSRRTALTMATAPSPSQSIRGPTDRLRWYANSSKHWGQSETVALGGRCVGGAAALEFDQQGVLLASADNRGIVSIYCFDECSAADIAVRRNVCREQSQAAPNAGIRPVRPIMAFSTRSKCTISCVKWNPHNEDQLAISFLTDGRVRIYDLGTGSKADDPIHVTLSGAESLRGPLRGEGVASLLFLSPPNRTSSCILTGGTYGTLRLWHAPLTIGSTEGEDGTCRRNNASRKNPSMIWSVNPFSSSSSSSSAVDSEGISSICQAEQRGLVLVGGSKGSLVLINKGRCTKKAFSTKMTPTVVWSSNIARQVNRRRGLVDGARAPSMSWMGIKKISLWEIDLRRNCSSAADEARLTVVTNCGWAFDASICGLRGASSSFSAIRSASLELSHRTLTTRYLNSSLEEIEIGDNARTFSLPQCPTPAHQLPGQSSILCIAGVRRLTKIMPSKDRRVLSSSELDQSQFVDPSNTSSDGDEILLVDLDCRPSEQEQMYREFDLNHNVVARIAIGKGSPRCLALHPSGEWMVVGFGSREELMLLCHRRKGSTEE